MNEQFTYRGTSVRWTLLSVALAGVSMCGGLLALFSVADRGGSLIGAIPPEYRIYWLLFLLLTVVLACALVIVRTIRSPLIDGGIRLEDEILSFPVRRGNRTERIELEVRTLTFEQNDDEALRIATPHGKFAFSPAGFAGAERFDRFRKTLTCARYRK